MTRKMLSSVVAAVAALALLGGCDSGGGTAPGAAGTPTSVAPSVEPSTSAPATPPAKPAKPAAPQKLKIGVKGSQVTALQQRLTALGYWNGTADGSFGTLTQQAVYALQKAAGLGRDGVVGPKTKQALTTGVRPSAKSKSGHVVEINLKRQLLMLVDNGKVTRIFNTATGSNQHYVYEGRTYLADTPPGHFTVTRQINGRRDGPLGPLWRPKYFNGGIAVHGAPNVPPYPASHGCARLTNAAINWIWSQNEIPLKTKVWVY